MNRDDASGAAPPRESIMQNAAALCRAADPLLLRTAVLLGLLAPVSAVLVVVDARVLDGANIWLKPLKFQVSVAVFLATLAVMMPLTKASFRRGAAGRITVWTAVSTGVFEIVWITLRAGIGERSHYATETPFGAAMYALMGVAAVLLSLTPVAIAIGAVLGGQVRPARRILRWAVALGALVGLVGASFVGLLLGGSPDHYPVDAQDASTRLPVAGWSTERGDLRIAHFVGLHAMQGLLVAGLLLVRTPPRVAKAILTIIAIGWLAAVLTLVEFARDDRSPFGTQSEAIGRATEGGRAFVAATVDRCSTNPSRGESRPCGLLARDGTLDRDS